MTPNQVVAANLIAAREELGLTQEEAAVRIERYLGERWSKAAFSARERSVDGVRIREFTADELVAMAMAFNRPIGWFFLPTVPPEGAGLPFVDPSAGHSDDVLLLELHALLPLCLGLREPATVNRLKSLLEREAQRDAQPEADGPANPRGRAVAIPNFAIDAAIEVVRGLVGASRELSRFLSEVAPSQVPVTEVDGEAEPETHGFVGHRMLVSLADEVVGINHRLEAIEQALGIGDKRKDNPDAWSHAEEG